MKWENKGVDPESVQEINELGCTLSVALDCAVHLLTPSIFECRHGVILPVYLVQKQDWAMLRHRHDEEKLLIK